MNKRAENHKRRVYENDVEFAVKKRSREYCRKYSLLEDELVGMLRSQGHKCALCFKVFSSTNSLELDHDHETGAARGFLCGKCNSMEGVIAKSGLALDELIVRLKKYYQDHSDRYLMLNPHGKSYGIEK